MSRHPQDAATRVINAMPTKQLFIGMLTRDIALIPAVLDLVDNCVDGARRDVGDGPYDGHWVRIEVSADRLRLADNCGGIPVDVAQRYAFRFGRDEDSPSIRHSIGQFGVGMKRAIFKIGDEFRVDSRTRTSRFVVRENIPAWASRDKWQFQFTELEENKDRPEDTIGTVLTISKLHPDVATAFRSEAFRNQLREELRSKLTGPISLGFAISLDGRPVHADPLELLDSRALKPAYARRDFRNGGPSTVTARFYTGLADPDPEAAGWHVFCNGRLVLEADKSRVTGWGGTEETRIPRFHGQFNRFRGYLYFDSDDAGALPWNTTKTGLDLDSAVYRASRLQMRTLMRPVIDFLNKLKAEKEESDTGPLQGLLSRARKAKLTALTPRPTFVVPKVAPPKPKPSVQRIQYDAPSAKAQEIKEYLSASTWVAVGRYTFDYFYDAELGDE